MAELRSQLREKKDAYWGEQVDIQWQVATAWMLHAAGKPDEALKTLSAAADVEDRTEKHPVTPGPLAPARELYGVMLLDRGMAKEALAAFEETLEGGARVIASIIVLLGFVAPANAQLREITGQAGVLGEWELTATVAEQGAGGTKEFVGPLSLKHVGICTVDAPEEKKGELRLRLSDTSTRVTAILLIEGTECTYIGDLNTYGDGIMKCPDRRDVPLTLSIK